MECGSQDETSTELYRLGIGMMMVNAENKIFVGQRLDIIDSAWQMPQGGVDRHETTDQAMLRELEEEIGTRDVEVIVKSEKLYRYNLPLELSGRLWGGKYKGQRQIWYALRFRGKDKDINIKTRDPEFRDWKWGTKDELLDIIVPFKKNLYECVLEDLWPYVLRHS